MKRETLIIMMGLVVFFSAGYMTGEAEQKLNHSKNSAQVATSTIGVYNTYGIGDEIIFDNTRYSVVGVNFGITSKYKKGDYVSIPTLNVDLEGIEPIKSN